MDKVMLEHIPKIIEVNYNPAKRTFSPETSKKIEDYWNQLSSKGNFFRGDVFTITKIEKTADQLSLDMQLTDYAHYLYNASNEMIDSEKCIVIYSSALFITSDQFYVFGEMASHTSTPGRLQCAGGGIEKRDIKGNTIDFLGNILREIKEETGLQIDQNSTENITLAYLKSGGDSGFYAMIYLVKTELTSKEFMKMFKDYQSQLQKHNQKPEFSELITLKKDLQTVKDFFSADKRERVDYLEPLLLIDLSRMST